MKTALSLIACIALTTAFAQDNTVPTSAVYAYAGIPASGTSEVDTLTIQTSTSAGTFTLTIASGRTTRAIAWSATDATLIANIKAAVEALSEVGVNGCTVAAGTGSSGIGTYTLTFTGKNAAQDFPLLSIGTNSLTGGAAPTITTTTPGVKATFRNAPTGTLIIDSVDGTLYQNTSTTAGAPTWTAFAGLSVFTGGLTASGSASNDFSGSTGTFKTSTGLTTISGGAVLSTAALSGAGAASVVKGTTKLTTTGASQAISLANGVDGQIITIIHDVYGGSAVLTPTTKTGFSTITFTNVGQTATLQYATTRGWFILALNGAVSA